MNLGDRIRSGTKWLLAGRLGNQFLQFGFGVALARILMPADFGMLVTIQVFTGVAGFFSGGGMGQALIQAKEVERHHYHIVFSAQLLLCIIIYSIFFVIAPWFSEWFERALYEDLLKVAALSFIIRPFSNIPRSMLQRQMRFKAVAMVAIGNMVVSGTVSVAMAIAGFGVWSLIVGGLCGSSAATLLLMWRTRWLPALRFDKEVIVRLGSYGMKMTATDVVNYIRQQVCNFIISRALGPSALGLFNKGDSLAQMPAMLISGSVYQTVFRALSMEQEDRDKSKYIYFRMITLVMVYTLPFYIGLWWMAEAFIVFVYGPKWIASADVLVILAGAGFLYCIFNPAGAVIAAQNRLGREVRAQVETVILLIVAGVYALQWGIIGMAWVVVGSSVYLALRMVVLANQCIGGSYRDLLAALKPALALNSLLFLVLAAGHGLGLRQWESSNPLVYLMGMGGIAVLSYTLMFLYLPIPALRTEAERWKVALKLAPSVEQ